VTLLFTLAASDEQMVNRMLAKNDAMNAAYLSITPLSNLGGYMERNTSPLRFKK
jgi:hypothetical protein